MSARPRILIVDDDVLSQQILAVLVQPECSAIIAENARRALELIERGPPPALIMLDLMLPDRDGFSLLKQLKQQARTSDIPVVLVSVLDQPSDRDRGLELGAIDYITKPYHPSFLKMWIRNHFALITPQDRHDVTEDGRSPTDTVDVDQGGLAPSPPSHSGSWVGAGVREDAGLTERERECLLWLARGLPFKAIAERLNVKTVTVELHLRNARHKLNAATKEQALAKAILRGLIFP